MEVIKNYGLVFLWNLYCFELGIIPRACFIIYCIKLLVNSMYNTFSLKLNLSVISNFFKYNNTPKINAILFKFFYCFVILINLFITLQKFQYLCLEVFYFQA